MEARPIQSSILSSPYEEIKVYQTVFAGETSPLGFVPSHFFHNQIAAVFSLPLTVNFQNLKQTIDSALWKKNWAGELTAQNSLMLFLNLCLIGLGLSLAWDRWRLAGLIPGLVEILYFLANALARTSGSRYLVPADWVIYFYYGLGLIQLAEWLYTIIAGRKQSITVPPPNADTGGKQQGWITPVISLFVLGMIMPLVGVLIPQRYPTLTKSDAYKTLQSQISLTDLGYTRKEIKEFLNNPDSVIFQGRLLYPRYFLANEGLCTIRCFILDAALGDRSYPRLTFVVLGPSSAGVIVEMEDLPENFRRLDLSKGPDVWVVGKIMKKLLVCLKDSIRLCEDW
jgi:hypothetical protein